MTDYEKRFRRAYDALMEGMPDPPSFDEITQIAVHPSKPWSWSWAAVGLAGFTAFLVLVGVAVAPPDEGPDVALTAPATSGTGVTGTTNQVAPATTPPRPRTVVPEDFVPGYLFGRPLPWTLVFDNGYDQVKALDVNNGIPYLSEVPGSNAGDQPYRLTLVDGKLIVGWGEIFAYDIVTRQSVSLGEATIYVPAAEDDRVWMIQYGGRIGSHPPIVWQTGVSGATAGDLLTEPITPSVEGHPTIGVPGGLAIDTDEGIKIWDYKTDSVFRTLGTDNTARAIDSTTDGRLAWCQGECEQIQITDLDGDTILVRQQAGDPVLRGWSARFSPDGEYLAIPTSTGVVLVLTASGETWTAMEFGGEESLPDFLEWAPGSHELFASTFSYGMRSVELGYHNARTGETAYAHLPYGGTLGFVVLPTAEASGFLAGSGDFVCPVTIPTQSGFLAPGPWPTYYPANDHFWYGSEELWTELPLHPGDYHLRKSVWWSVNFPGGVEEEKPPISVTWRRLDDEGPVLTEPIGTNATTGELGWHMIAGIDPEEPGCWLVTATYKGATLSYVYDNR